MMDLAQNVLGYCPGLEVDTKTDLYVAPSCQILVKIARQAGKRGIINGI